MSGMLHSHKNNQLDTPRRLNYTKKTYREADGYYELKQQILDDADNLRNTGMNDLPSDQGKDTSINWLGSSYSGVDVKVVAHLYDNVDKGSYEKEAERVQNEIDFNTELQHAAILLRDQYPIIAANTLTTAERKQLLLTYTGLGAEGLGPRILQILLNVIYQTNFSSTIGVARGIIALDNIINDSKKLSASLAREKDRLSKIEQSAQRTVTLGTLQTISVQSHREKFAVRALGHAYAKGYTRGPRTIAGSMIFTLFDEHAFAQLIRAMGTSKTYKAPDEELKSLLPDQLPPIDLTLLFANEYGSLSRLSIYGVEFLNDGATFSIEDLLSENVVNFVARDVDVLTKLGNVPLDRQSRGQDSDSVASDSATNLIFGQEDYQRYLETLRVRRRLVNR